MCCLCAEDEAYTTHAHTLAATQRGTHCVSKRCRCFQKAKLVVQLRPGIELHLVCTCLPAAEIRVTVISCKFQGIPKHEYNVGQEKTSHRIELSCSLSESLASHPENWPYGFHYVAVSCPDIQFDLFPLRLILHSSLFGLSIRDSGRLDLTRLLCRS